MKKTEVFSRYVGNRIGLLEVDAGVPKQLLAELRKNLNKPLTQANAVWEFILHDLPDEFRGRDGVPSYAEEAIYTALVAYAVHRQGQSSSPHAYNGVTLGKAMNSLTKMEFSSYDAIKRRFDRLVKSNSMADVNQGVRYFIQMFRKYGIKTDYTRLARDLYFYQFEGSKDKVLMSWAMDFYRYSNGSEESAAE